MVFYSACPEPRRVYPACPVYPESRRELRGESRREPRPKVPILSERARPQALQSFPYTACLPFSPHRRLQNAANPFACHRSEKSSAKSNHCHTSKIGSRKSFVCHTSETPPGGVGFTGSSANFEFRISSFDSFAGHTWVLLRFESAMRFEYKVSERTKTLCPISPHRTAQHRTASSRRCRKSPASRCLSPSRPGPSGLPSNSRSELSPCWWSPFWECAGRSGRAACRPRPATLRHKSKFLRPARIRAR